MKINFLLLSAVLTLSVYSDIRSQGFTPPPEGKAVVYFARVSSYGSLMPFDFFDGDLFIGDFAGKKYLRYVCEPGEHLFWASSENKAFMTADLAPGQSYVVIVDVVMGFAVARVGLSPIDNLHKVFPRARSLINKKPPVTVPEQRLTSENQRLASFIREKLDQYEKRRKDELTVKHLSSDMAIDAGKMVVPEISH